MPRARACRGNCGSSRYFGLNSLRTAGCTDTVVCAMGGAGGGGAVVTVVTVGGGRIGTWVLISRGGTHIGGGAGRLGGRGGGGPWGRLVRSAVVFLRTWLLP